MPGHVNGTSQVSLTERQSSWPMGKYVFKPFLCAIHRVFSTADLPNDGEIFVVNNHSMCKSTRSGSDLLSMSELLPWVTFDIDPNLKMRGQKDLRSIKRGLIGS